MRGNRPKAAELRPEARVYHVIPEWPIPHPVQLVGPNRNLINVRMAESQTLLAEAETLLAPLSVTSNGRLHQLQPLVLPHPSQT
jgi:hypothetical protein